MKLRKSLQKETLNTFAKSFNLFNRETATTTPELESEQDKLPDNEGELTPSGVDVPPTGEVAQEQDNNIELTQNKEEGMFENEELHEETAKQEEQNTQPKEKVVAYVTQGQTIHGSIESSDNLVLEGIVYGDIIIDGNLAIYGTVKGNVTADNVEIINAQVEGNIDAKCNISMKGSNVTGNFTAENIALDGVVRGTINASNICCLLATSNVEGDITSAVIEIKRGSHFNGTILMVND